MTLQYGLQRPKLQEANAAYEHALALAAEPEEAPSLLAAYASVRCAACDRSASAKTPGCAWAG